MARLNWLRGALSTVPTYADIEVRLTACAPVTTREPVMKFESAESTVLPIVVRPRRVPPLWVGVAVGVVVGVGVSVGVLVGVLDIRGVFVAVGVRVGVNVGVAVDNGPLVVVA